MRRLHRKSPFPIRWAMLNHWWGKVREPYERGSWRREMRPKPTTRVVNTLWHNEAWLTQFRPRPLQQLSNTRMDCASWPACLPAVAVALFLLAPVSAPSRVFPTIATRAVRGSARHRCHTRSSLAAMPLDSAIGRGRSLVGASFAASIPTAHITRLRDWSRPMSYERSLRRM